DSLAPAIPQYRALVVALARYRALAADGGWPVLPGVRGIDIDSKDKNVTWLIARLAAEDALLSASPDPSTFEIAAASGRLHWRLGPAADGRVGPAPLAALNIPVSARIAQIAANMERWRWMPRQMERRYIMVNVPDQSLDYVDGRDIVLHSRVVI